jgi:hypothetical protein
LAGRGTRRGLLAGAAAGALAAAILGVAVGAGADTTPTINVEVNGSPVTFDSPPVMLNDHVYLPIRYVAQALGLPVEWDGTTDTVYVGAAPGASAATGGSFVYQGLQYSATGLAIRQYPGQQNTSGVYWIVSYSITDTGTAPVNVPQSQPALELLGPGGAQLAPTPNISGPTATTINPGITFTSYAVFNVPQTAVPAAYGLGFETYQVVGGQFTTTPLSASLPPASTSQVQTTVGSSYALQNVWNSGIDKLSIDQVIQATNIVPDLTAPSFNPATTFWIVDFDVTNPGPGNISLSASNFTLEFNGGLTLAPSSVGSLPGYVPATSLTQPGGVLVTPGGTFSGALLFAVPGGTPTDNPGLSLTVGSQTRVVSLEPCNAGVCPPVQGA